MITGSHIHLLRNVLLYSGTYGKVRHMVFARRSQQHGEPDSRQRCTTLPQERKDE
jgi:hypothetical protein